MSDTPRTDQLNNGLLSACQESAIYNFMLNHARTLERELNAAKAEIEAMKKALQSIYLDDIFDATMREIAKEALAKLK